MKKVCVPRTYESYNAQLFIYTLFYTPSNVGSIRLQKGNRLTAVRVRWRNILIQGESVKWKHLSISVIFQDRENFMRKNFHSSKCQI